MRGAFISSLLLVSAAAFMSGAGPDTRPTTQPTAMLTVHVTDLRNQHGQLIFAVFKTADGFPTDPDKAVYWEIKPAAGKTVDFTVSLPPGRYGASVLHDENKNGKMDKNAIGIPVEGYGETNNPKPATRAATFKESLFTLPPEGATLTVSIQYFL